MATRSPTPAAELTARQVLAWRMRRQLVHPPGSLSVAETVSSMVGAQAQVQSWAELAVALRRRAGRVGEVRDALAQRTVLRTWAMRGTLHVLEPGQAAALLALLATSRRWELPSWQAAFGVGSEELEALTEAVRTALHGRVLEREELIAEIAERTGRRDLEEHLRSGWGGLLKPLAWRGHLCNGPSRGGRVTFTLPETWLPSWPGLPPEGQAARTVIPAYLRAYGPVTVDTFAAWLARGAVRRTRVQGWFDSVADLLVDVTVAGQPRLALAADLDALRETRPARAIRMLAGFDSYLLGPGTADTSVIPAQRRSAVSRTAGWISPVVLAGGRVAGIWRVETDQLAVTLFGEAPAVPTHALATEASRVGAALARGLALTVATD
ncbi:MAG: winged helix DNA-binding domain-containing protein [Actinomycetota bacterium]|nr:winged helix DNA-binding domain-containing protein [Actinomycetota bacterium]